MDVIIDGDASTRAFAWLAANHAWIQRTTKRQEIGNQLVHCTVAYGIDSPAAKGCLLYLVREGWGDDPARYREMGLEFPKD